MTTTSQIINYFNEVDKTKKQNNTFVTDTDKGIFGVSSLDVIKQFLTKIKPDKKDIFVDIGSGDGRVNILASLFCNSLGIEFDQNLVKESIKHNIKLKTNAEFLEQDYETYNFSETNMIFSFADHFFTPSFIEKLKKEFKGILYIYQGIFTPNNVKKGPTIWINQVPIISFEF